jgi:hypothetical protein
MQKIPTHNVFIGMRITEAGAVADEMKRLVSRRNLNIETRTWLRDLSVEGVDANLAHYVPYEDGYYFCPQCAVRYGRPQVLKVRDLTGIGHSDAGSNVHLKLQCSAPQCLKIYT